MSEEFPEQIWVGPNLEWPDDIGPWHPDAKLYIRADTAPANAETPGATTPELLDLVNRIEYVIERLPESLIEWRRQAEVEGALANLRLIYRDGLRVHLVPLIEAIKREVGR